MCLAIFGILWLSSCRDNDLKEIEILVGNKTAPAETSTGVEIIYSDSAKVKAKLNAAEMERYTNENPRLELSKGLKIQFFDTMLHVTSYLTANRGTRYTNKGLTELRGNVHVVNLKGDTMDTEELFWNEQTNRIYSNKFVKVKTKAEVILAEGFESDITFSKYTFYKIKGIISVKE
jgi:LPS export ABC transporter protein LptC